MSISEKDLKKLRAQAKVEIGEVEEEIPKKIINLKRRLADDNINLHPSYYDEFYLQCLRAAKYDLDKAVKFYKNYCTSRHTGIKDVKEITLPSVQERAFRSKMMSMLALRDHLGRQIIIIRMPNWDPKVTQIESVWASLILILDEALTSVDSQLQGFVIIADCGGFSWSHAKQIGLSQLQAFLKTLQGSYPARFKEIHLIFNHALIDMILAAAKPFMKEKMRNRLFSHRSNLDSLHNFIDPAILPEFLGGKISEDDYDDKALVAKIMQKDDYYKDFLRYGYI